MRVISTRAHGVLDYLVGMLLIASPWLLNFYRGGAESYVPIILGIVIIFYSFFTDYELGVVKSVPMAGHLTLDVLGGIVLAVSPWLFGFNDYIYKPHLWLGIAELGVVLLTDRTPYVSRERKGPGEYSRPRDHHHA